LLTVLGTATLAAGLVLVVSPLLAAAPSHGANPRASTVQKVFPSAVRVQIVAGGEVVRSASGIGFAHDAGRTYVLTNAHVVEPSRSWKSPVEVKILAAGAAQPLVAKVVACGKVPDTDLAVLEVPAELPITALGADEGLELGDDLVVIGAPFGKGLSVAAGIVSQVEYEFAEAAAAPRSPRR
jgi:S1-C subfamily serine protease